MSANTVLKTLTDTAFDSVEGYRKAAEKANNPELKQKLMSRAEKRQQSVAALNAEVERQGGEMVTKGTMTGELHQMWLGITSAFESNDEAAAERVEEGEDYIKGKFEAALESDQLDDQSRAVVQQVYAEICEGEQFGNSVEKQYD